MQQELALQWQSVTEREKSANNQIWMFDSTPSEKKDINTWDYSLGWSHQHKTILCTTGGQNLSSLKVTVPKSFSLLSVFSSLLLSVAVHNLSLPRGVTGIHSRGLGSSAYLLHTHTHTHSYTLIFFSLSAHIYCTLSHFTSPFALPVPLYPPKI